MEPNSNDNGTQPAPGLQITRDDELQIEPMCPPLQVTYRDPPKPDLTVQMVFGMIGEEPCMAVAILPKGKLEPEQYRVSLLNIVNLIVAGRPEMEPKDDTPKSRIILPPGTSAGGRDAS